jgi:hypothetical protein
MDSLVNINLSFIVTVGILALALWYIARRS